MNRLNTIALALSLALSTGGVLAAQPTLAETAPAPAAQPIATGAHLGVGVESIPPALAAQLPAAVPRGQGVMIVEVQAQSPAADAGLQPYDILMSYDDQKLFSADQLSALAAADQPGRSVTLSLVRGGQLKEVQVKLGEGARRSTMPHAWQPWRNQFPGRAFPTVPEQPQQGLTKSFESLNIEKLEDGQYRAAIEYLDADGNKLSYEFKGSRKELQQQIAQSDKLPPAARRHLLNALNMKNDWPMPRFWGPLDLNQLMQTWRGGGWMPN